MPCEVRWRAQQLQIMDKKADGRAFVCIRNRRISSDEMSLVLLSFMVASNRKKKNLCVLHLHARGTVAFFINSGHLGHGTSTILFVTRFFPPIVFRSLVACFWWVSCCPPLFVSRVIYICCGFPGHARRIPPTSSHTINNKISWCSATAGCTMALSGPSTHTEKNGHVCL